MTWNKHLSEAWPTCRQLLPGTPGGFGNGWVIAGYRWWVSKKNHVRGNDPIWRAKQHIFFQMGEGKNQSATVDKWLVGWSSPPFFAYIGKFSSDFVLFKVKKVFFLAPKYLSLMVFFGVFLHLSLPNSTRVSRWYFHKFIDKVGPESWGGKDSQRMSKYNLKRS